MREENTHVPHGGFVAVTRLHSEAGGARMDNPGAFGPGRRRRLSHCVAEVS